VHFKRIDQLRGFAALAVVLCHVKGSAEGVVGDPSQQSLFWLSGLMGWGYLGVPLFFVISGLCIHLPSARALAAGRPARPRWRQFFQRRFWRLYPPYFAALVLAAGLLFASTGGLPVGWRGALAEVFLVHTFHPATFEGLNPPDWTLSLEAQLYLAYPVVWLLFARLGGWRGLGVVMAVTMLFRASLNFDWTPTALGGVPWEIFLARWFEWALGALIALWAVDLVTVPRWTRAPWVAAAVLALAVLAEWQMWRPGAYTFKEPLYGVAFALVVLVTLDRERAGKPTAVTPIGRYLADVGAYSYSLYLVHRPIQMFFEPFVQRVATARLLGLEPLTLSLILMTATTPLVLIAARLLYRYCEAPCVAVAQRIGRAGGPEHAVGDPSVGRAA
jgi:peptidoglycan/LPS O-acetylase OafA/YrhL